MSSLLTRLNWVHLFSVLVFHALALVALFVPPRPMDLWLLGTTYLATGFGITVGFHRMVTHRGFVCPPWLRNLLAFFGTAAMQGGPIAWANVHRRHHQTSDAPDDPHTPLRGFFFSHMGWVITKTEIDRSHRLVGDLLVEPFFRWLDRPLRSAVPGVSLGALCYLVGGWQGVLWGVFLRTVLVWHATWCVNSFSHTFGSRLYETNDGSRNLWWVGLVALGEGWHNNHHAWPRCAFHGHLWWQFDASSLLIRGLERLGLADRVMKLPEHERLVRRRKVA